VKRIDDVPWPLQEAINHGLTILSWFENYTGDDLPPENWWDDAEAVEEHFKRVRERRGESGGGASAYDKAEENGDEMAGNDLASFFKE
jgi:hypothetical protein